MTEVKYICPITGGQLKKKGNKYISNNGTVFKIKNNIPRFSPENNYANSFGFQWNLFNEIQLDSFAGINLSANRFWSETNWNAEDLKNLSVLEAGSGAGRFTEVFLKETSGVLYSFDYSNAVDANLKNNYKYRKRLILSQSSIYNMPFANNSFDRIFCLGVLQHTPCFANSLKALISKLKVNGEIVIDFYPSKGIITKIHSKYLLRPITKRFPKKQLLFFIKKTVNFSLFLFDLLCLMKLGFLTRFLPITDIRNFPNSLNKTQRRKWAILDTFDAFSPEFDNPQKIDNVIKIFSEENCEIQFAGQIKYSGGSSTVVRAVKR